MSDALFKFLTAQEAGRAVPKRGGPPEQPTGAAMCGLLRDKHDENTYPIQISALQRSNIGKIKVTSAASSGSGKSGYASPDERSAIGISATIAVSLALWKVLFCDFEPIVRKGTNLLSM
jgi:hypothetical protein